MTMPLEHDRLSVRASGDRPGLEHAGIASETHRPALVADIALLRQEVDHRVRCECIEFRRVRVVRAEGRARELDDHALHPHAETERWHTALATKPCRLDLALDAAVAKAARDDDPVESDERFDVVGALE